MEQSCERLGSPFGDYPKVREMDISFRGSWVDPEPRNEGHCSSSRGSKGEHAKRTSGAVTKGFRSSVLSCCRIADGIIYSDEGNRSENTKVMATSMGVLGVSTWDRANTRRRMVNGWIEQGSVP